jgi:regulator of replication initiation timing
MEDEMRSLEVTEELRTAAHGHVGEGNANADAYLLRALARAIVAQARAEAPATSCRGCNHERHPSLACGECERAGHVCTGLATHRSVVTAPAAQVGLPVAEVVVTTDTPTNQLPPDHLRYRFAREFGGQIREVFVGNRCEWYEQLDARFVRAFLDSVQAEHDRARAADRRRIEELERRLKTERAMKEGCQSHLLDIAAALDKTGADHEEDEPTSRRVICVLADLRRQLAEVRSLYEADHNTAELWRRTSGQLVTAITGEPCELAMPDHVLELVRDLSRKLGEAKAENADLRRQLGEARAEVADLLPRLDAAALENTQLGRERDGARNELAEAIKNKDTLIIENNTLLCRAEDAESECDDLRAWKEGAMAVMAEWDGLRKLVEDGSPAQLGRGLAENTERVIRDLRAKVEDLTKENDVVQLLRAKVERRTALLTTWLGLHDHPSVRWWSTKLVAEETRVELGKDNEHAR